MAKFFLPALVAGLSLLSSAIAQDLRVPSPTEVLDSRNQYQQAYAALRESDPNLESDLRSRPPEEMLKRIDVNSDLRAKVLQAQAKYYRALRGDFQKRLNAILAQPTQPKIEDTKQTIQKQIDSLITTDINLEKEMQALQPGEVLMKQAIQSERDSNSRLKNTLERQRIELDNVDQATQGSETARNSFLASQKAVIDILQDEENRLSGYRTRMWNSYYDNLRKAVREGIPAPAAVTVARSTPTVAAPVSAPPPATPTVYVPQTAVAKRPAPEIPSIPPVPPPVSQTAAVVPKTAAAIAPSAGGASLLVGVWEYGGDGNFTGAEPITVQLKINQDQSTGVFYAFYTAKFRVEGVEVPVDLTFRFRELAPGAEVSSRWETAWNGAHGNIRLIRYSAGLECTLQDSSTSQVPNGGQLLRKK